MERPGFKGNKAQFVANAAMANSLFLKLSRQSRISIVVAAAFNVFASAAVVATVLYDSWRIARLRVPRKKSDFFTKIPTAHVFAFALAIATMIQGTVFISVQSMEIQNVYTDDCRIFSQITWTATWVVGFTILVFSTETTIRSLNPSCSRFPCKNYPITNWIVIVILLVLTWIPSKLRPARFAVCTATLIQWVRPWSDIGTGLASGLILFYLVNAVTLLTRLRRSEMMCFEQRIAIRNQVYYLFVNAAIFVFTLPFWVQSTAGRLTNEVAMIMTVVINLYGIVNGILFLLLRATGQNLITRSANPVWFLKPPRRYTESTEMAVADQIIRPIGLERNISLPKQSRFSGKPFSEHLNAALPLKQNEKSLMESVFPDGRSSMERLTEGLSQNRESVLISLSSSSQSSHKSGSSVLSMTDIESSVLLPPQPYFSHRRRSSDFSAATVQIGLCLSSIPVPASAEQLRSSSRNTSNPTPVLETLTSARFSPLKAFSSKKPTNLSTSSIAVNPFQAHPPTPTSKNLRGMDSPGYTIVDDNPFSPKEPPAVLRSASDRAAARQTAVSSFYSTASNDIPGTPPDLPYNPLTSQAVPRRGRKDSAAWPLPERFSALPDKTYSQVPWI